MNKTILPEIVKKYHLKYYMLVNNIDTYKA